MPYHGTDIDNLIPKLPGPINIRDGTPIPPSDFPDPQPLSAVLDRSAAHLQVPRTDPRVRHQLRVWYEQVSPQHVVARKFLRPEGLAVTDARHHPRRLRYRVNALTRIVAHLREHPRWIADSWSAAALLGIGEFSDGADTCIISSGNRRLTTDPLRPTRHRNVTDVQPWTLYLNDVPLRVTPPMLTLVRCLRSALAEEHAWQVPKIGGMAEPLIRAVQVTDRFRRLLGVEDLHILQAGQGLIGARKLARITSLSSPGMDSSQETLLKLIAQQAATRHHVEFLPQVPVYCDGRVGEPGTKENGVPLLTVLDLALPDWKIALMFDGAHHWDKQQRERDARINFELTMAGWLVLRISHGMLDDASGLATRISDAIRKQFNGQMGVA